MANELAMTVPLLCHYHHCHCAVVVVVVVVLLLLSSLSLSYHWEELKGAQVLKMEEYIGNHKRGTMQGPSVEQNMTTMSKVGVCGCHEISTITVSRMDSF